MGTTVYVQQWDVSGCMWGTLFSGFASFIHIRTFVLSLWNGLASPAPSPSEELFLVWEPAQGLPPHMLSSSHSFTLSGNCRFSSSNEAFSIHVSFQQCHQQGCWAAPHALAVLMEGTGNCQQHPGACVLSKHSSCFEGCRAGVGEQGNHSGGRQGQEWKWTETARGKSLSWALEKWIILADKLFLCPWQEQQRCFISLWGYVTGILFAAWVGKWIWRNSEGSAGWWEGWDRLREAPAPPTLSTQHTQCQRAPALLSLQTKQNPSRSCAEILCSCLWHRRFGGTVTATAALCLVRINSHSEGHKWCSQGVKALNCCVVHRVFFFNLPYESIMERLSQRRTDPVTGERWALLPCVQHFPDCQGDESTK